MEEELEDSQDSTGLNLSNATEYVREQLAIMGVDNVTDKELEAYTKDFLQLLREKEQESESSFEQESEEDESSVYSASIIVPPSAVYKTVLQNGSDNNVTTNLTAISSPTPSLASSDRHHLITPEKPVLQVSVRNDGTRLIKRKVLRQIDVTTDYGADNSIISDTSVHSVDNDHTTYSILTTKEPIKSFIRPTTGLPQYIKGTNIKKCDPVQRYHQYNQSWKMMKVPGEEPRHAVRWHIREQLLLQDIPSIPPSRKPQYTISNYTVPTSKKRQSLRWQIRHQLASKQ